MRSFRAALVAGLLPLLLGLVPAAAQTADPPRLVAISVSPFAAPDRPLQLDLLVRNPTNTPLDGASLRITIHRRVVTRSELRLALDGNPVGDILAITTEDLGEPIAPGGERAVVVSRDLGTLASTFRTSRLDGVYPVSIQLRAGVETIARAFTAVPFFFETPQGALNVVLALPFHWRAVFDAGNRYANGTLDRAVVTGGFLDETVEVLSRHAQMPVTFAPTALTLDQLDDLGDGYVSVDRRGGIEAVHPSDERAAAARNMLLRLKQLVGNAAFELAASTYARADLIGLAHEQMRAELDRQFGAEKERFAAVLEREPSADLLLAPSLRLDARSAVEVAAQGPRTVVVAPEQLPERLTRFGYDRPQAVTGGGGVRLTALVADPAIRDRLAGRADPALIVQAALAESAASFFELPALAPERLLVIATPGMIRPSVVGPLLDGIAAAPWIKLRTATDAATALPPTEEPVALPIARATDRGPLAAARAARHAVETLGEVVAQPQPVENLERFILASESTDWLGDPQRGSVLARAARGKAENTLSLIRVPPRTVTLTSRIAQIPVTILNDTGQPVRVRIELEAPKVTFPDGASRTLEIDQRVLTTTFRAETRVTGSFPITVRLRTPEGDDAVGDGQIIVRSTTVSAVTLVATGGGVVVIAAGWARRAIRYRRKRGDQPKAS